jgi:Ser-tRNA(Ala) deacylase AlaX
MMHDEWSTFFGYVHGCSEENMLIEFPPSLPLPVADVDDKLTNKMMTMSIETSHSKPVYLDNTYMFEMATNIASIEAVDGGAKGSYKLILQETIFHPQGGGQPSDTGGISLDGVVIFEVRFVQKYQNTIEHFGNFRPDLNLHVISDKNVLLHIDKEKRIAHARLHSAGHVLDAALERCGLMSSLKARKGYHFTDGPYVEYEGTIKENSEQLLNDALEALVKESISTSVVQLSKRHAQEVLGEPLDAYPDVIRIVNVAGIACPCGGTHVHSTAELRGLRVTKIKRKKELIRISYDFES